MRFHRKKYYFLIQNLDPLLIRYPNQSSDQKIKELNERKIIQLPNSHLNQNSWTNSEKYYVLLPEFLPIINKNSVVGLLSIIRPELNNRKVQDLILDIRKIYDKFYNKFKQPIVNYFLILQMPTMSHYQVLQKLSFINNLVKSFNIDYPNILLFPKFVDSSNALWPVIIRDLKWLNQFQGNIDIQNKQFLKLLDSNHYEVLNQNKIIDLPSSKQLMVTKNLCFGCRQVIHNEAEWVVCDQCGAIICIDCNKILKTQPIGENLCPGNIFVGINFHLFDTKENNT